MDSALEVFSDLSERLNYNLPDFPLYVRKGTLIQFDRYSASCHWHSDLEFIVVLHGAMEYFINGQTVTIEKGNGIFVNSKRLHYGFSSNKTNCSYIVTAIHPSLLGENAYASKVYFEEKFGSSTEDFLLINSETIWQKEILLMLNSIYNEMNEGIPNPLRLLSQAASLCALIGDHLHPDSSRFADYKSWLALGKMTNFIHRNYDKKITLNEIAYAGAICRSRCCELFSSYIDQTPNNYLNQYRIKKSCEMLKETDRSISEIALACGFLTPSYFSYAFRKEMGIVP